MMVKPTVTDLLKNVDNRFELVVATAKRARQLSKGEKALIDKEEASTVTLAADEIEAGKVTVVEEPKVENDNIDEEENEENNVEE